MRRIWWRWACVCVLLVPGCAEETATPTYTPALEALVQVVPSDRLPTEVTPQLANNNLDVIVYEGRLFLAFRTAPFHFADAAAELVVVSRLAEDHAGPFRLEGRFHMGTDLREPRFLDVNGELWFYFAVLGELSFAFEPQGMMATRWAGEGQWSEPQWAHVEGFIPWRARQDQGEPTLIGYVGGEHIYDTTGSAIVVQWLRVIGGTVFEPVDPGAPHVIEGGASETDWARLDDGSVVAVSRLEAGDARGYGSLVCTGSTSTPAVWTCDVDPRKYDSPLVFVHEGQPWLVGRRNVTESGAYDLGREDLPPEDRFTAYQMDYWQQPKRCALWRIDPETRQVSHALDLPSRGDTCFASIVPIGGGAYHLYNYSSDVEGPDLPWNEAQLEATHIYRMTLRFE